LNDGFMHPAFPQQVQLSYYQASLVCELIARDWRVRAAQDAPGVQEGATTDVVGFSAC
jgi:hypothetical protein